MTLTSREPQRSYRFTAIAWSAGFETGSGKKKSKKSSRSGTGI